MKMLIPIKAMPVDTIGPFEDLAFASLLMQEQNLSFLAVVSNGRPIGVLTPQDVTTRAIASGARLDCLLVKDIMTPDVAWIYDDVEAQDAMRLMRERNVRHLLVRDRYGEIIGQLAQDHTAVGVPPNVQAGHLLRSGAPRWLPTQQPVAQWEAIA